MENLGTIVNGAATLVMAVAAAILGFTIPGIWTLQSDMGGAKATLVAIDKRLDGLDKRLDGFEDKLVQIAKHAEATDLRLSARDTDPATVLAASGLRPTSQFIGVRVGDKIYALPRTDDAATMLERAGAKRTALAPTIFGFQLGTVDESGGFITLSAPGLTVRGKPPEGTGPAQ